MLPQDWQAMVKDKQVKFVVSAHHSFNEVENDSLIELLQLAIDIGAKFGNKTTTIDAKEVFYGRQTIASEAKDKAVKYREGMASRLSHPVAANEIALTIDLWRDDFQHRYYLDVSAIWLGDNEWDLKKAQLRCKLFDHDSKTAENVLAEIDSICEEFGLDVNTTPMTTDKGSNFAAGLKAKRRIQCFGHRLSTVEESAWNDCIAQNEEFRNFDQSLRDIASFAHRCDISELPVSVKNFSATRPWRSYYLVPFSIQQSFQAIKAELDKRHKEALYSGLNLSLLDQVVNLFGQLVCLFDWLEGSYEPTVQNVLPTYYRVKDIAQPDANDLPSIVRLKQLLLSHLEAKYLPDLDDIHFLATELDPSFKTLDFVLDLVERESIFERNVETMRKLARSIMQSEKPRAVYAKPPRPDPFRSMRSSVLSSSNIERAAA